MNTLHAATLAGPASVDALGLLVELKDDVKAITHNKSLETPLHIAGRSGRLDIAQKLINCAVTVCACTKDGSTPLHHPPAFGQSQVLETLVKVGCQPRNGAAGALLMVHWLVVSASSSNMLGKGAHKHRSIV